jgi:Holliday junction DNA helicase RuvA
VIATLRGRLTHKGTETLVVEVGGVGYLVTVPLRLLAGLGPLGEDVFLHVHTYVREDQIALYGFGSVDDRQFFELLMSVKGIGPKVALGMISQAETAMLKRAVFQEDRALLASVPGIGPKTAARVILELKDRLKEEYLVGTPAGNGSRPEAGAGRGVTEGAIRALTSLGYREAEARRVTADLDFDDDDPLDVVVTRALQALDGGK